MLFEMIAPPESRAVQNCTLIARTFAGRRDVSAGAMEVAAAGAAGPAPAAAFVSERKAERKSRNWQRGNAAKGREKEEEEEEEERGERRRRRE